MAFRISKNKELIAFEGENCRKVIIDGKSYEFANALLDNIAFAPSLEKENEFMIYLKGKSTVSIPIPAESINSITGLHNESGKRVKYRIENNSLQLELDKRSNGQWLSLKWE